MPREADTGVAGGVNIQPSLFDDFTDPLQPGETPLSDYDDEYLATLLALWGGFGGE